MIDERDSEVFDFAVEETIEAFPLVRGVVVESSESCSQVLKVLDCPRRVLVVVVPTMVGSLGGMGLLVASHSFQSFMFLR